MKYRHTDEHTATPEGQLQIRAVLYGYTRVRVGYEYEATDTGTTGYIRRLSIFLAGRLLGANLKQEAQLSPRDPHAALH